MKTWLTRLMGKQHKISFPAPWRAGRPSLYAFLARRADAGGALPQTAQILPDEEPAPAGELRWAAGALDGVLNHHVGGTQDESPVGALIAALQRVLRRPDEENMAQLYALLQEAPLAYIDDLLSAVSDAPRLPAGRLRQLAEWLATESPDRNAVKVAMALLAFFPTPDSIRILTTLGAHDEFTLFAIVALSAILPPEQYERHWLALARRVRGWGRVQMIERLPQNPGSQTRAWLLREGYINEVMYEYTAWHCATCGQLLNALRQESDAPLLLGAGEILQALINGGPARDIDDYPDGAAACRRYLQLLQARAPADLRHYLIAADIARFAQRQADEGAEPDEEQRAGLGELAAAVMAQPGWDEAIADGLNDRDDYRFNLAVSASRLRGRDPWPVIYARQLANPQEEHWYQLMRTQDPRQAAMTAALAEKQLDLAAIASGPADHAGMGEAYRQHRALDFVLQELKRFPGLGRVLLETGLQSPVIRNRHMALNALEVWPQEERPSFAPRLAACLRDEPDEDLRRRLSTLWRADDDARDE